MNKEILAQIRKLVQQYAYTSIALHEAVASRAGFSGTDHRHLGFLIKHGPMTAGEFASLTGLTTGAITGLVDRFEKRKLVKRRFDENDRRKVIIEPDTKKIMALLEPLYKEFRSRSEKFTASFSEKELGIVKRYLTNAIEIMQESASNLNNRQSGK